MARTSPPGLVPTDRGRPTGLTNRLISLPVDASHEITVPSPEPTTTISSSDSRETDRSRPTWTCTSHSNRPVGSSQHRTKPSAVVDTILVPDSETPTLHVRLALSSSSRDHESSSRDHTLTRPSPQALEHRPDCQLFSYDPAALDGPPTAAATLPLAWAYWPSRNTYRSRQTPRHRRQRRWSQLPLGSPRQRRQHKAPKRPRVVVDTRHASALGRQVVPGGLFRLI
jgi:hypothetical protein